MGLGPAGRIIKKGADAVNGFGGKVLALFGRLQDMLPGRQIMQIDAEVFHGCLGAGKDAVKKDHEYLLLKSLMILRRKIWNTIRLC